MIIYLINPQRGGNSKIIVFIAYFGKLPNYFDAWKISVLKNDSIDFCIFSDSVELASQKNIKVFHINFDDFVKKLQSKFEFKIKCDKPYKLCDYRPMYGSVFAELTKGYDFWGYCDLDLVFGDIRTFITDDILEQNDRILINGHFSLYRNCPQMNNLYLSNGTYPEYNVGEAYTTNDACYFDEFRGMELKCLRNKIRTFYASDIIIDIPFYAKKFGKDNSEVYYWNEGKLYLYKENSDRREILYAHFQKRIMICEDISENTDSFVIIPNKIKECSHVTNELYSISMNSFYPIIKRYQKIIKALKKDGLKKTIKRIKRQKEVETLKLSLKNNIKS